MLGSFHVGGLEMSVNIFFYVSSKKQANITAESVQWHYDHRWVWAEKEILFIAGDGVGNLICLDMLESGNGRVVMWIHDPLLTIQYVAD